MCYGLFPLFPADEKGFAGMTKSQAPSQASSFLLQPRESFFHRQKLFSCILPFLLLPFPLSDLCWHKSKIQLFEVGLISVWVASAPSFVPPSSSFSVVQVKKIPLVPALFSAPLIWILKLDNNMELCLFSVPWWFPAPSTEIAHAVCCVAASQAPEICFLFDTCQSWTEMYPSHNLSWPAKLWGSTAHPLSPSGSQRVAWQVWNKFSFFVFFFFFSFPFWKWRHCT